MLKNRETCYKCYRAKPVCLCSKIQNKINTNTKFVILMHPKEYRKTKNGTGFLTANSLNNSEVIIGIDFSKNEKINEYIKNYNCFILYPHKNSINITKEKLLTTKNLIFIIDSTWACSKKILKSSTNLHELNKISFDFIKESNFKIKKQPSDFCLSTIESTQVILELLNKQKIEDLHADEINDFLIPFKTMVKKQITYTNNKNE